MLKIKIVAFGPPASGKTDILTKLAKFLSDNGFHAETELHSVDKEGFEMTKGKYNE